MNSLVVNFVQHRPAEWGRAFTSEMAHQTSSS